MSRAGTQTMPDSRRRSIRMAASRWLLRCVVGVEFDSCFLQSLIIIWSARLCSLLFSSLFLCFFLLIKLTFLIRSIGLQQLKLLDLRANAKLHLQAVWPAVVTCTDGNRSEVTTLQWIRIKLLNSMLQRKGHKRLSCYIGAVTRGVKQTSSIELVQQGQCFMTNYLVFLIHQGFLMHVSST